MAFHLQSPSYNISILLYFVKKITIFCRIIRNIFINNTKYGDSFHCPRIKSVLPKGIKINNYINNPVLIKEIVLINDYMNNGTVPLIEYFGNVSSCVRIYLPSVNDEFGSASA